MRVNFTARGTAGRDGGSMLLDQVILDISAAFARIERFAGLPLGYAPLGADGLIDPSFLGELVTPSTLMVSATAAANTSVTATLPAVAGKVHLITSIQLVRAASAAFAGGSVLVSTSTNLPGNPAWSAGSAIGGVPGGGQLVDLDLQPALPMRAAAAGVATTITMPAAGAAVVNRINVTYLLGDP